MSIGGDQLLADIESENPKLGAYLRHFVVPAITTTAQNAAVSPTGKIPAPAPPESVNVTTSGEYMQITVDHNAPVQKGVQYVSEISTNPQFSQPIIHDHGSSRAPVPFPLPSNDGVGAPHSYYVRTMAQYQGSDPSAPTYHGGASPVAVTMGGATNMTLLPPKGSGTGSGNGQQAGVGLGISQLRQAVGPKRNVS